MKNDTRSWVRAKAVMLLLNIFKKQPQTGIIEILLAQLTDDKSLLVRSLIARLLTDKNLITVLKKVSGPKLMHRLNQTVQEADLNPWHRKDTFKIIDVGCENGDVTQNIMNYYATQENIVDQIVLGIDNTPAVIIEAERKNCEVYRNQDTVVFMFGDVNKQYLGDLKADAVISENLLIFRGQLREHAQALSRLVNNNGGRIYFTPSIERVFEDTGGEDARNRVKDMAHYFDKECRKARVFTSIAGEKSTEDQTNPFGGSPIHNPFGSRWAVSAGWAVAEYPSTLKVTAGSKQIYITARQFPDQENYVRILNPQAVNNAAITVETEISNSGDSVRIILLLDLLKSYDAQSIKLIVKTDYYNTDNQLLKVMSYFCKEIECRPNGRGIALKFIPPEPVKRKKLPIKIDHVVYHRKRLAEDAQKAADNMQVPCTHIGFKRSQTFDSAVMPLSTEEKISANPLDWIVEPIEDMTGKNVLFIHSSETAMDITELIMILANLRGMRVESLCLLNLYSGYSRQDKVFKDGEGISALTMLKIINLFVDKHFTVNVHYADSKGLIRFGKYNIFNLNAFPQVAMRLFEEVALRSGIQEINAHPEQYASIPVNFNNSTMINKYEHIIRKIGLAAIKAHPEQYPLLLMGPDDGAYKYNAEAAEVVKNLIKSRYGINLTVHAGYCDKVRLSPTDVIMGEQVIIPPSIKEWEESEQKQSIIDTWKSGDVSNYTIFIIDDESSSGSTILAATYMLYTHCGVAWNRIYSGVVHGKLARGLTPFETGRKFYEKITIGKPKPEFVKTRTVTINKIKHTIGSMPPSFFVATRSVKLPKKPVEFPATLKVPLDEIIRYTTTEILGKPARFRPIIKAIQRLLGISS
ncbi:MAG: hypothetical protein GF384_07915 [Elusimicrobia bacterium]|nr:hypothetical protein [Elusimicrobiota bacterium]MBD3412561.1 hypothetical protein [Elusimicrobiota bacterium]